MAEDSKPQVTFVLTGPREGFTGMLGGRYGFRDGRLTVNFEHKDILKLVLCTRYCCNVEGEAPIWESKDGASVKVREMEKPKPIVTGVVGDPKASVEMPPVKQPAPELKVDVVPELRAGPEPIKVSKSEGD